MSRLLAVLAVTGALLAAPVWAAGDQKPCGEPKKDCPKSESKCSQKGACKDKDGKQSKTQGKKAKQTK